MGSSGWLKQKARCGKAEEAQLDAILRFKAEANGALPEAVLRRPWCGMGAPLNGKVFEDERGARKVTGRADDLGTRPAV